MGTHTSEFVRWRPAPALRGLVEQYVCYRDVDAPPATHRGLPSPTMTLIITLDEPLEIRQHPDPRTPGGYYDDLVGGLHTSPALVAHQGRQSGIQLALSPLGARALLGLPAGELASTDRPAADVWGPFAGRLREQVCAAATWADRCRTIDALLTDRIGRISAGTAGRRTAAPVEVVRAWDHLLARAGNVTVRELAEDVGWSTRHLAERFAVEIGLSPKAASRVVRFHHARQLIGQRAATGGDLALADLAVRTGYYDQAHLNREFQALAGLSPTKWLGTEFRNVQASAVPAVEGSSHDD